MNENDKPKNPISLTPELAYKFAKEHGPYSEEHMAMEMLIATDAIYSFWYAKYVLRNKFPAGEPIMQTNEALFKRYIDDVVNHDFQNDIDMYNTYVEKYGEVNERV